MTFYQCVPIEFLPKRPVPNLLSLHNVKQVMEALGDSMESNAGEYRIDGWARGTWYHKENETLEHVDYEMLSELTGKTLTVDLQDGLVHSDTEEGTRLKIILLRNTNIPYT